MRNVTRHDSQHKNQHYDGLEDHHCVPHKLGQSQRKNPCHKEHCEDQREEHNEQRDKKKGCECHADGQDGLHEGRQEEQTMELLLSYALKIQIYFTLLVQT